MGKLLGLPVRISTETLQLIFKIQDPR